MSCPKHPGADTIKYKTAAGKRCSICAACYYSGKKKKK